MRDFEYLVIDDGSTDDTEEVVQSFSDERIKYHKLSENSGNQVVPNNYALERARGYFIAYLGHDDLWCKNHLDVALAGLSGFTQMVYTIAVLYTRRTLLTGITEDGKYRRLMSLPMSSVVHTSQLYREIGPWRSRREQWDDTGEYTAPDIEFIVRAHDKCQKIVHVPRLTVFKFPSNRRSYIDRPCDQQEEMYAEIQGNSNIGDDELLKILTMHYSQSRYRTKQAEVKSNKPGKGHPNWRFMKSKLGKSDR
jgi:glycosyltransferase involved in cell wall biosynthesis